MIALRLDPNLEKEITTVAKNLGLTKSDLIRKSLIEYIGKLESPNAWELGKDFFGRYSSGLKNLSVDRKTILKERIRTKRK
jgi:RHH-type transcriptional regulator, rel operon repressor / antitoxin RelB